MHEHNDPADWSASSCGPDTIRETLRDALRDAAAGWKGNLPATRQEFVLVAAAVAMDVIQAAKAGLVDLDEDSETLALDLCEAAANRPGHFATGEILAELIAADNPRMLAQCYDIAGGFGIQGKTQQAVADEHGISRAEVSKVCRDLKNRRSLAQSPAMRSDHNREVCRARELAKPKRRRESWKLGALFKATTT